MRHKSRNSVYEINLKTFRQSDTMAMTETQCTVKLQNLSDLKDLIPGLVDHYKQKWWNTSTRFPGFSLSYSLDAQMENEKRIELETNRLVNAAKHISTGSKDVNTFQEATRLNLLTLANEVFLIQAKDVNFVEKTGLIESACSFFEMARDFDPGIPFSDIYQAGRNIITANLIQLLLGLPVRNTPSLFAYSMLYPYSDNFLDDPAVSSSQKKEFNQRFYNRLIGETTHPLNRNEEIIDTLIQMIESEWDREKFPVVYQSLLAIHTAQVKSLDLVSSDISPFEKDILGITFEKGGTSVLADGYLAAGTLLPEQIHALFGFGAFTQLMDDMEDICSDIQENRASLFSISAPYWKLDTICNRFFNFGRNAIQNLRVFPGEFIPEISNLINKCIDPMLLGSIPVSTGYFSKTYCDELDRYMPVRFTALKKQRQKFYGNKDKIILLVEESLRSKSFAGMF